MTRVGRVRIGSASSTPVVSRPAALSADVTSPVGRPACTSIRPCITPPVAAPPGSTLLIAFPTACDAEMSRQRAWGSAIR